MSDKPPSAKLVRDLETLEELLELAQDERRARLEQLRVADAGLAARVERLLAAEALPEIEPPLSTASPALSETHSTHRGLAAGAVVGSYEIRGEIGRGGMGLVYLGSRRDAAFEQRVAIKVLASPFASRPTLERMHREARILGRLNHPGIARILDVGALDDETPYLVLEHVEGRTLNDYCDEERCTIERRIELFLQICDAVSYAHKRLVVHRDIKPGNVLIDGSGAVKLLDFGIGKILEKDEPSVASTLTRVGGRALTPDYASPEQLSGDPATTQSDVYSLGVVLYELLCGERPFKDGSQLTRDRATAPSRRLSETPMDEEAVHLRARRLRSTAGLRRRLVGDLDAIVLQALHPDPQRRYGSVDELVRDLRALSSHQPVSARPDSLGYRSKKFLLRHRLGVSAALFVTLALILGITLALWQAGVAARERDVAETAAHRAERTSDLLQQILTTPAEQLVTGQGSADLRVTDLLAAASERALSAGEPVVEGTVRRTLAATYTYLGLYEEAESEALRAVELHRSEAGAELAQSTHDLGAVFFRTGRFEEAADRFQRAIDLCATAACDEALRAPYVNDLALALQALRELDRSIAFFREALELHRANPGSTPQLEIAILSNLGQTLVEMNRPEEAEASLREALSALDQMKPERSDSEVAIWYMLALLADIRQDWPAAVEALDRAISAAPDFYPPRHPFLSTFHADRAVFLAVQGELEEALVDSRLALDIAREAFGESGLGASLIHLGYGDFLCRAGETVAGLREVRTARDALQQTLPEDNWQLQRAHAYFALCRITSDRAQAMEEAWASLARMENALGPEDRRVRRLRARLDALTG